LDAREREKLERTAHKELYYFHFSNYGYQTKKDENGAALSIEMHT
jgi:hypothetical protein